MSNDKGRGSAPAASPRFPGPRQTAPGKPAAKPHPRGEGDANAVNIPQPASRAAR